MAKKAEYKIISGFDTHVEQELNKLNITTPWKPILFTSVVAPTGVKLYLVAERELGT